MADLSIFSGLGELVDEWLELPDIGQAPHYKHLTAAKELASRQSPIGGTSHFLASCYEQISNNWQEAVEAGYSKPSRQNWRWQQHTHTAAENRSPEVLLERAIVEECGDDWSNQMPTASGLCGPSVDKRAAVDLVHRNDTKDYSFIELKVASDTPLYAAIEILMYGLVFIWSRNHLKQLNYKPSAQPLLAATAVSLEVLAPGKYYADLNLANLQHALQESLPPFAADNGLKMQFRFLQFNLPDTTALDAEALVGAIDARSPAWAA